MLPKRWFVKPAAPPDLLSSYGEMSAVLAQVLYNRSLHTFDDARRFLTAELGPMDPFKMKGMHQAVGRIRRAIKAGERIVVYGDFDADGVTATVLLVQALAALGANVTPYIPHRIDEGYGLNSDALLKLAGEQVRLVVTVDCGIRSVDEVEAGKAAGLDIIVTDHHSLGPELPRALAVINPKQEDCNYTEDMLAGVGVAYKLAEALFHAESAMNKNGGPGFSLDALLDLVAIGTVADLAPLNRIENRLLVRRGLEAINAPKRMGLRALMGAAGISPGKLNAGSIGFALGPRINAAGRLDSAMKAYDLLAASDPITAEKLATELNLLNVKRQDLTRAAQATIRQRLEDEGTDGPLIFASDRSFPPGIVGLVAGRLAEEYYRPAIIMETGESESRASCRSIPQFDITQALDQCADLLVRHGGHAQAAGFTILNENLPALKERLTDLAARAFAGQELAPTLDIDAEVLPEQMSMALVNELSLLEPVGHHNETPLFVSRGLRVQEKRTVGKNGEHLKLRLMRPNQMPVDAIGFHLGAQLEALSQSVDLVYEIEINEFNGSRNLQLNVQDVRAAVEA